ncbi:DUF1294 domain-containing protein [Chryseobacterium tongliaoense]|uniref:DUF1294 domain-containing protein n=1 Tax=Chryseobacterium tongliaoense TaxID=3240933 RepID=UPI0035190F14
MIYILFLINLFSLIVFGWDKRLSVRHKRRISENMLLGLTFFGGTIGSVLGIIIFRHKISKASFLLKLGVIILIQAVLIYFFEKYLWY